MASCRGRSEGVTGLVSRLGKTLPVTGLFLAVEAAASGGAVPPTAYVPAAIIAFWWPVAAYVDELLADQ